MAFVPSTSQNKFDILVASDGPNVRRLSAGQSEDFDDHSMLSTWMQAYKPRLAVSKLTGDVFVIMKDFDNNTMFRLSPTGTVVEQWPLEIPNNIDSDNIAIGMENNMQVVFYCDTSTIKKRNLVTEQVVTVAGIDGRNGYNGDGILATEALINYPSGISLVSDDEGNVEEVYFADSDNYIVRRISRNGTIETVAGIPQHMGLENGDGKKAVDVPLATTSSVLVHDGQLYFSDVYYLRRVDLSTGVIKKLAGNRLHSTFYNGDGIPATEANVFSPRAILIHPHNGNIYFDDGNARIRKINAISGIISTIAGNGYSSYSGDGGPAIQSMLYKPDSLSIYSHNGMDEIIINDQSKTKPRKIDTNQIISNFTMKDAIFYQPTGETFFRTDYTIEKLLPNGTQVRVAGVGQVRFGGDGFDQIYAIFDKPTDLIFNTENELLIAEKMRIRKIGLDGTVSTVAGNGKFVYFHLPSFDGANARDVPIEPKFLATYNGCIYFTDYRYGRVKKIDGNGIITTVLANYPKPTGLSITSNGDIYFASQDSVFLFSNGIVKTIDTDLNSPEGLFASEDGHVYIADAGNRRVKMVYNGTVTTIVNNIFVTNVKMHEGILYVTGYGIAKIVDGVITKIAGLSFYGFYNGNGMLANQTNMFPSGFIWSQGEILFADPTNSLIRKLTNDSRVVTVAGGVGDGGMAVNAYLDEVVSFIMDPSGDVLIVERQGGRLRRVSNGIISTESGDYNARYGGTGNSKYVRLYDPTHVTRAPNGDLFVTLQWSNIVSKISQGKISLVAGSGRKGWYCGYNGNNLKATEVNLNGPTSTVLAPNGDLYISDTYHCLVWKLSAATGNMTIVAGTWVANNEQDGKGWFNGDSMDATNARLNYPTYMVMAPDGISVILSDKENNRVRILTPYCPEGYTLVTDGELRCKMIPVTCFGKTPSDPTVCSAHGVCSLYNKCTCNIGYFGSLCEQYSCYNIAKENPTVCNAHGICSSPDNCTCSGGYSGSQCDQFTCHGIPHSDETVCSENGQCTQPNHCTCKAGYLGEDCSEFKCWGRNQSDQTVCSGNGACESPNTCECNGLWKGHDCSVFIYCENNTQIVCGEQHERKIESFDSVSALNSKVVDFGSGVSVKLPAIMSQYLKQELQLESNELEGQMVKSLSWDVTLQSPIVSFLFFDQESGDRIPIRNLSSTIDIVFTQHRVPNVNFVCAQYDERVGEWRSDHIQTTVSVDSVTCSTFFWLTSFTLIATNETLPIASIIVNGSSSSVLIVDDNNMWYILIILCVVALLLIVFVIGILGVFFIRKKRPHVSPINTNVEYSNLQEEI